jgi:hypothetical protein
MYGGWRACQMLLCGGTRDNQAQKAAGEARGCSINKVGAAIGILSHLNDKLDSGKVRQKETNGYIL